MTDPIHVGDALEILRTMEPESVHCCVTSPPYWGLRDFGVEGQLGLEETPEDHVAKMVEVFREVRRVLRSDGTCWVNYGDCYASTGERKHGGFNGRHYSGLGGCKVEDQKIKGQAMGAPMTLTGGLKPKDLVGMPWRVAFGLQADGWFLRSDIIWAKPNPMPESVTDRPTKAHEYVFLLTKSARYWYDAEAVREEAEYGFRPSHGVGSIYDRLGSGKIENKKTPGLITSGRNPETGRNARTVWTIPTAPYPEAHFATFPPELARRCIVAGCPKGGTVLDPFVGSGTTIAVAIREGREGIGIELNPEYAGLARARISRAETGVTEKEQAVGQLSLLR